MKKIVQLLSIAVVSFGLVSLLSFAPDVAAIDPSNQVQQGVNKAGGKDAIKLGPGIKRVVNLLLFVIGAIAVIVIVIGGILYTISNGDQAKIKQAKDSILYAVIGLIVAMLAFAIVNFVVGQF